MRWLLSAQRADGSFLPNRFGDRFVRGVTGLCALALMHGNEDAHRDAVHKALRWLAEHPGTRRDYGHAFAAQALCRGSVRWPDVRKAAEQAIRTIVASQHETGGWVDGPASTRTETCLTAAMLDALATARAAKIEVAAKVVDSGLRFLEQRFVAGTRMFDNEPYPSPSYGATGMATATLFAFGRGAGAAAKGGLAWLKAQGIRKTTENLRGKPFRGYLRGRFHFELAAHARALRNGDKAETFQRWQSHLQRALAKQQTEDGAWDGWFGKPYGTALCVEMLSNR